MSLFAGVVFADNPQHVFESHAKLSKAFKDFRPDPLRVWKSDNAVLVTTADSDWARCPLTVPESGRDIVAILATSRLDHPEELAGKLGVPYNRAADKARAAEVLLPRLICDGGSAVPSIWTAISPLHFWISGPSSFLARATASAFLRFTISAAD